MHPLPTSIGLQQHNREPYSQTGTEVAKPEKEIRVASHKLHQGPGDLLNGRSACGYIVNVGLMKKLIPSFPVRNQDLLTLNNL